jgi:hypothetical protein
MTKKNYVELTRISSEYRHLWFDDGSWYGKYIPTP